MHQDSKGKLFQANLQTSHLDNQGLHNFDDFLVQRYYFTQGVICVPQVHAETMIRKNIGQPGAVGKEKAQSN